MTREDFQSLGAYASSLWPKFVLNAEQHEIWYHHLRHIDYTTARQALANAYAGTKWKEPTLPEVREAIKHLTRATTGKTDTDFPPEFVQQVQREEEEEAALLASWTPQEFEDGKAEIIRREPGMKEFSTLPANGVMWRHFLCERYVHQRATVFPNRKPIQIARDEHWAVWP